VPANHRALTLTRESQLLHRELLHTLLHCMAPGPGDPSESDELVLLTPMKIVGGCVTEATASGEQVNSTAAGGRGRSLMAGAETKEQADRSTDQLGEGE
jgi:hypothetical protein